MTRKPFSDLGLDAALCRTLENIGFNEPTPIQDQAIPVVLDGGDLLGIAQTGTGKTAAFVLPTLQYLKEHPEPDLDRSVRCLILAPTRELALQIRDEIDRFGDVSHTTVIGGVGENPQIKALRRGVDILVATPGRLLDLANSKHVTLEDVEVLVLDEADRLLDMGFIRDVRKIIAMTPDDRQTLLFSATMPKEVADLARDILIDPARVDVSPKEVTVKDIEQRVLKVEPEAKQDVLTALLRDESVTRAIVFTRTKYGAEKVARKLKRAGIGAEAIHGNKSQNQRVRALQAFSNGDAWVLVATDIAARGIDVNDVSHVINFELPHEPESYVHRIGRTGRAGKTGVAWALVAGEEQKRLKAIERLIGFAPKALAMPKNIESTAGPAPTADPVKQPLEASTPATGDGEKPARRRRRRPRRKAA